MPYSLGRHASCPATKPFAVLRGDGKPVPGGCHAKHGDALEHQRALQANVPDASATELLEAGVLDELHARDPGLALRDLDL